jgi:STE24 endopeptidase
MIELVLAAISPCSEVAVPEATAEAMRFYKSGNILWAISQGWSFIVPLLFLLTGFSAGLAKLSQKWGRNWFFTLCLYLIFFIPIYTLLNLPLDFYAGYVRAHEYGLSSQSLGRWFNHFGKNFIVVLVSSLLFVWIFYLLLKKSPKRWWLYSSFVTIAIMFITAFIQPIWIDPLFNRFGPMKDKALEKDILDLAARAGIEHGRVFEVDKSQDTKMLNAYVVGFGNTNRIVLWDTTLQKMSKDQILFVMGHEMGHYVLHHIWWFMIFFTFLSLVVFYLIFRSARFLMRKFAGRFGFHELSSIASLPLLLLLINFFTFLSDPLMNYVSRTKEHEADRFGLEITQNNQAAAEAFVVLQQENLANPRPGLLYKVWRSSHPPLGERIDYLNNYCPWRSGEPLKYQKYFQE